MTPMTLRSGDPNIPDDDFLNPSVAEVEMPVNCRSALRLNRAIEFVHVEAPIVDVDKDI